MKIEEVREIAKSFKGMVVSEWNDNEEGLHFIFLFNGYEMLLQECEISNKKDVEEICEELVRYVEQDF